MKPDADAVLVASLLAGRTQAEAAAAAGVSDRTLRRRLRDGELSALLARERRRLVRATSDRLLSHAADAVDTLIAVAKDPEAGHAVRVSAAKAVLTLAADSVERADLLDRLDALEALVKAETGSGAGAGAS